MALVGGGGERESEPREVFTHRGVDRGIKGLLSRKDLAKIDAYWRAANYLSVGQTTRS